MISAAARAEYRWRHERPVNLWRTYAHELGVFALKCLIAVVIASYAAMYVIAWAGRACAW